MKYLSKKLQPLLELINSIIELCYDHCNPILRRCHEHCKPIIERCREYCKHICKRFLEFYNQILERCTEFYKANTKFSISYAIVTPLICIFCIFMCAIIALICYFVLYGPWLWFAGIVIFITLPVAATMMVSYFVDWYEETWGIEWHPVKIKQ